MNSINNMNKFDDAPAASISALMDGALHGQDADAALAAAAQPEGRERWQLYHLIGDTLRAADLAAHHDEGVLAGVRAAIRGPALVPEPVRWMPAVLRHKAANDGMFRWKLVSGFASVVAVVAIGWNVWSFSNVPSGQQMARAQAVSLPLAQLAPPPQVVKLVVPSATANASGAAAAAPDAQRLATSGDQQMLRDPQLDRLLAAHRRVAAFGDGTSVFLRNATFEEPER
jgi:sigma-E factor negative regulatory protein RseA